MKLSVVKEICWRVYQNGKPYANNQQIIKPDILQKCKTLFADIMRQRYYESKAKDEFGRPDYSFSSPVLSVKRYALGEANERSERRCDMGDVDLYRLPSNSHFTNVYPIGEGCGKNEINEITQVSPGEENFYRNDPDFHSIAFYVVKGTGINAYNVPPCIKSLDIETTHDLSEDEVEVDMSAASLIIDQVLGISLGIKKQYYSDQVQEQMKEQNVVQ